MTELKANSDGSLPTEYLTCREVAALIGCTPDWVWKLVRRGRLKAHKIGTRRVRIDRDQLTDWLNRKEPDDVPR